MDSLLSSVKAVLMSTWGPASQTEPGKWNEDNDSDRKRLRGPAAHAWELLPTAG